MEVATSTKPMTRQDEFRALIRDHQAAIWRYLRFLGSDEELAADLVQETFLAVWRKPFEDRGSGSTRAYLRTVGRNLFLMSRRRDKSRPVHVDLDAAESEWARHDEDDGESYREALRDCLAALSDRARKALDLFYRDQRSRTDVAVEIDMTPDGVKTLMRRSRESLRGCIEKKVRP
jgi:RNA polymerase sigma-70 factor (ECF subfamily)